MQRTCLIIVVVTALNSAFWGAAHAETGETSARKLINSQGCKACHTLEGDGGVIAGSFEAMGATLTRAQIRSMLVNPEQQHGKAKIPDFSHLAEEEIDALVDFIKPGP